MRRYARGAVAFGFILLLVLAGAAPARAVTDASLAVRTLDTTEWPTVTMTVQYTGNNAPSLTDFTVRNNGQIVDGVKVRPLSETKTPVGVVLVVDTSGSMREAGRMDAAKAAANAFIAGRGPTEKIAVVSFNDRPTVAHAFSTDNGAAAAIDGLTPAGGTALWDAVRLAAGLFNGEQQVQPNIVVLSDGADSASTGSAADARNAAIGAHAVVHTVGFASSALDNVGLEALAHETGGQALFTTTSNGVGGLFNEIRKNLNEQFELSFTATGDRALDLTVAASGATTTARGAAGSVSHESDTRPERIPEPGTVQRFGATVGRPLAILAI
ncbi:MAG: tight adherence protein, partial [Actinomycetota bacterium]